MRIEIDLEISVMSDQTRSQAAQLASDIVDAVDEMVTKRKARLGEFRIRVDAY